MARTPKARALGAALRQAREDKNLFLRQLAAAINRDTGVLSRWETGERTPKPEHVAQILTTLGVGGDQYDEIMSLAYGTGESKWVATTLPEQRQQMVAYVDWEQSASRIVEVAPMLVPGLLQTGDYAHSIMTADSVPAGEIAARVTSRLGRSQVITKANNPAELLVLLGQSALNRGIGGRQVMIEQLEHLVRTAARPNIELRVIPDNAGWHPGLEGAFALIESDRATAARSSPTGTAAIVFVETRRSELMLHEDGDVAAYRRAVGRIRNVTLEPDVSARLVADYRNRMEKNRGS